MWADVYLNLGENNVHVLATGLPVEWQRDDMSLCINSVWLGEYTIVDCASVRLCTVSIKEDILSIFNRLLVTATTLSRKSNVFV